MRALALLLLPASVGAYGVGAFGAASVGAGTREAAGAIDTLRWTILMQGNPAGEEVAWRVASSGGPAAGGAGGAAAGGAGEASRGAAEAEVWRFRFRFNDRGRGPEQKAELALDPESGLPVRLEISGLDYLKKEVGESFVLEGGEAEWLNQAEDGRRRLGGPALYAPLNGGPALSGFLARALLRAPGGCLDLIPAGRACIERLQRASLSWRTERRREVREGERSEMEEERAAAEAEVALYEITGLGFAPVHVWLDADSLYFGNAAGWLTPVRAGHESLLETLKTPEEGAEDAWLRGLAERIPERPSGPVAIVNARLFDPERLESRSAMTVVWEGERIRLVGPSAGVRVPEGARVIDAEGRTLLPGLIDMHVHLSPVEGVLHVAAGVTTVRDLANDIERVVETKRGFDEGTLIGPRVILAGFLDGPGPFAGPTRALVSTEAEVREWVERYAELGYEQIKMYSSIDTALVPAIVREAHARGLRVSGHIPAWMTAEEAVRAGFDEIQHANMLLLNFLGADTLDTRTPVRFTAVANGAALLDLDAAPVREFVELLKERDVVVDPTLAVFENMFLSAAGRVSPVYRAVAERLPPQVARGLKTGGLPVPEGRDERWREERYRASFRAMQELVARLHRAGVRIVAGTDAMAGFALHRELELYEEAGIPAPEVLRIATLGAAEVAGRAGELGSVEPGKIADFVLVDGEPDRAISDIRNTALVVKGGVLLDPARLYRAVGVAAPAPAGR